MLINVKMSLIVGILTFISMIHLLPSWVEHEKFYNIGARIKFCYHIYKNVKSADQTAQMCSLTCVPLLFTTQSKFSLDVAYMTKDLIHTKISCVGPYNIVILSVNIWSMFKKKISSSSELLSNNSLFGGQL